MNLAIDIGNTQTKYGVFEDKDLQFVTTNAEIILELIQHQEISKAILSKVGGKDLVETALFKMESPLVILKHQTPLPILNKYKTPETLGADRLAAAVGANALFPNQNILSIDAGTCITYDYLNSNNEYEGGGIAPGINMRLEALNHYTQKLPLITLYNKEENIQKLPALIGQTTEGSILSGVLNGIVTEVSGTIDLYSARFGDLKVIVTGGDAHFLVSNLKMEIFARPALVLEGLNRILLHTNVG